MAGAPYDRIESEEPVLQAPNSRYFWQPGPVVPSMGLDIDVWRIDLRLHQRQIQQLGRYLSEDEHERAGRFHFQEHRVRFVAAHGILRVILGRYLGVSAAVLKFGSNPYGKPFLSDEFSASGLSFNLSHSNELALLAVVNQRSIGVDIEYMRPDLADEKIARRFFSNIEVDAYLSLPGQFRNEAFFTCWTRKEAYIKARGEGLSMALDSFDVSLIPGEPAKIINTRPDPAQALQWKLYPLYPSPGYCAALAVQGDAQIVHGWQWDAGENTGLP